MTVYISFMVVYLLSVVVDDDGAIVEVDVDGSGVVLVVSRYDKENYHENTHCSLFIKCNKKNIYKEIWHNELMILCVNNNENMLQCL